MELDITIQDVGGANAVDFTVPGDVPAKNIIAKLLTAMNLPTYDPSGTPMSYVLHHVQTQRQINQEATLVASDVKNGDALRLVPQIIAGGSRH